MDHRKSFSGGDHSPSPENRRDDSPSSEKKLHQLRSEAARQEAARKENARIEANRLDSNDPFGRDRSIIRRFVTGYLQPKASWEEDAHLGLPPETASTSSKGEDSEILQATEGVFDSSERAIEIDSEPRSYRSANDSTRGSNNQELEGTESHTGITHSNEIKEIINTIDDKIKNLDINNLTYCLNLIKASARKLTGNPDAKVLVKDLQTIRNQYKCFLGISTNYDREKTSEAYISLKNLYPQLSTQGKDWIERFGLDFAQKKQ